MDTTEVRKLIEAYDAPWAAKRSALVAVKHTRMLEGSFPFLRAAAPLYFQRLKDALARPAPGLELFAKWMAGDASATPTRIVWCAGDVHVENFGAYRAGPGDERFGLNDFDDVVVAPLEVDVLRHLVSIIVASRSGGASGPDALGLVHAHLEVYAAECWHGQAAPDPGMADTHEKPIKALLDSGSDRSRADFINKRAPKQKGGKRRFVENGHYHPLEGAERDEVIAAYKQALAAMDAAVKDPRPGFYEPIDVAGRTAGLGSLGCGRYAILVEGKGGDDGNVLLELKEAKPASLARTPGVPLKTFEDEAARVLAGILAIRDHPHHMSRTVISGDPYYLRRLAHNEERIDLLTMGASVAVLRPIVEAEARALARAHARSRKALGLGPLAAVTPAERTAWTALAVCLAGGVESDYLAFCNV